ncbi:uncharacterized protein OCT59_027054 [Rhizophagus irregularis]|uniref:Uncharacterized protein n=2 Tax=Rhizophagus irregularis TaxID=588596 RepID=A0A015JAW7_RHIIW|nr:hypothetical protein GLOIN_2v563634 [Rhizophagus irregularis DAOM 181602=DAOM 197198]EXX64040.1 hypothetical protein RirG_146610 [Rhizophagus irregularis DAOM 197198w]UZO06745.1 hypothetical protein OCT59_027054 [Rhizophagus irregularis]POG63268.1 hypothetical protein GLOIN_2v563634 [Rhizophagus irregularis DAOM 181602=DAOM 197198]CAB4478608.1 unnamed protein product [Rhizophagus irregularis]CAB5200539.1 unnamed protein product [Rhizophagus irregularis]|eukprot:XP_025170134.1 hypothetical protein GLOIN_2v563634 [Rhizophagus irregularis DAOM 181602=DAOM 197198]
MNQDQAFSPLPPFNTTYPDSNNYNISLQQNLTSENTLHVTTTDAVHPSTQTPQLTTIPLHPTTFFFRPPNDFCHYYVNCKEICYDTVTYLLNKPPKEHNVQSNENECIFYYRQQIDTRFYQVLCEIVSPLLINSYLNKNILGIDLQNSEHENLTFTINQKDNLEYHLKQYLSLYLLN